IPANNQIRRFIWEHLNDVHRIFHRFLCAGATISAKKLFIAVPEVVILRHKCNYDGRIPDDSKVAWIRDWPECKNLSDVRAFLGTNASLVTHKPSSSFTGSSARSVPPAFISSESATSSSKWMLVTSKVCSATLTYNRTLRSTDGSPPYSFSTSSSSTYPPKS